MAERASSFALVTAGALASAFIGGLAIFGFFSSRPFDCPFPSADALAGAFGSAVVGFPGVGPLRPPPLP